MNDFLSKKIKFFSFFFMVLVVLLHSQNVSNRFPNFTLISDYNKFIQAFVSGGVCQIAVPGFFLISGYLYFLGQDFTLKKYFNKTAKRINTLLIPFVLTSILIFLFFLLIQQFAFAQKMINNKIQFDNNILADIGKIFTSSPSYQLWFIKDLMVICVFLVPIIYILIKFLNVYSVLTLFFVWAFFSKQISSSFCPAISFFSIGAYISYNHNSYKFNINKKLFFWFVVLWFSLIILSILVKIEYDLFINASIIIGLLAVWNGYDFVYEKIAISDTVLSLSFFLYLFHEPLLTFIIKIFFFIMGFNNATSFLAYILSPIFTICIVMCLGYIMRKYFKEGYNLLTGNR